MINLKLFKLGHKSILAHKVFSIPVILIVGIVFGILVNNVVYDISHNAKKLQEESSITDGKALIAVKTCDGNYLAGTCDTPEKYDKEVFKKAQKYNGETIGARITYTNQQNENVYVILERAGKILNHEQPFYFENEKIPVLANSDEKIDENIYEPYFRYKSDETPFYIMMDNTTKVMNFLVANNYVMKDYEPLVVFGDEKDAYEFFKNESNNVVKMDQLFNESIIYKKKYIESIKTAFLTIILALATIAILFFVFEIVISKLEQKNIYLYREVGATKADIIKIYLYSAFELFVFSMLVSLITVLVIFAIITR